METIILLVFWLPLFVYFMGYYIAIDFIIPTVKKFQFLRTLLILILVVSCIYLSIKFFTISYKPRIIELTVIGLLCGLSFEKLGREKNENSSIDRKKIILYAFFSILIELLALFLFNGFIKVIFSGPIMNL